MLNTPAFTTKRKFRELGSTEDKPLMRMVDKENHIVNAPYYFNAQPKMIVTNKDPFVSFAQIASNILATRSSTTTSTPLQPTKVQPFNFTLDKRIRMHTDIRDEFDTNTFKFKALELDKNIFKNPKPLVRSKSVIEFKEFNLSHDVRSLRIEEPESLAQNMPRNRVNQRQFAQPDPPVNSKNLKKESKYKSTTDLKTYLDKSMPIEEPRKCNAKLLRTEIRGQQRRIPF